MQTVNISASVGRPAHVALQQVVDFDFYRLQSRPGEDIQTAWWHLQQSSPDIFWTPRNGGHWVATRAADIEAMQVDHARFSHASFMIPAMESPIPALPLDRDPPEHAAYRMLINPALAPNQLAGLETRAREVIVEVIEKIRPQSGCEFMGDIGKVLPIVVFLGIVGLPTSDREMLLPWADDVVRGTTPETKLRGHQSVGRYLMKWIEERTANPGDDLISKIVHAKVMGRAITPAEILGLCSLVLVGGLDTVASMLGFATRFLALNPAHRRQLIDEPELIPQAVEEIIRRHGLANTARLITHDFEYKGVQFRKGEQIQLPNCLVGLDDRVVSDPLTVDFKRQPQRHAAFGNGPHKCPGGNLARAELKVFLQEWLARIPDFEISPGTTPVMACGMVNGMMDLRLRWAV